MAVTSRYAFATLTSCHALALRRPMTTSAAKAISRARGSPTSPSLLRPRDLAYLAGASASATPRSAYLLAFDVRKVSSSSSSPSSEPPSSSPSSSSSSSSSPSSSSTAPPPKPGPWAHGFVPGPAPKAEPKEQAGPDGEMPAELKEMKKILELMDEYEQQIAAQTAAQTEKDGNKKQPGAAIPGKDQGKAELPPELKAIMDEYERRMEDKPWYQKFSVNPMIFGALIAGMIVYVIAALDDVSSELHVATAKWLQSLEPEVARRRILRLAAWGLLPSDLDKDDPYLVIEPQEGLRFVTPVGLATGYDVEGVGINSFLKLGFGHVEVGPIRSAEAEEVLSMRRRLANRDRTAQVVSLGIVGVCLRGQGAEDLVAATEALAPFVDYIDVDARGLPEEKLRDILSQVVAKAACVPSGGPSIFVRLHPNFPAKDARNSERIEASRKVASAAIAAGVTGMVLAHAQDEEMVESGFAKEILGDVYKHSQGRLILVASGRFPSGFKALEYIEQGATLVQISDQLGDLGFATCRKVKTDLSRALMQDNITQLSDCVGAAHRKKKVKAKNLWKAKGSA